MKTLNDPSAETERLVSGVLTTEVIGNDEPSLLRSARWLAEGGVVAFPTETVYGLGARVDHDSAVEAVFDAKKRPRHKALIVHVSGVEQARAVTLGWDERAQALADRFWPGPVTIILRAGTGLSERVTAGGITVAVRAPGHPLALRLIEQCGGPIAAASANLAGEPPPTTAAGVLATLDGRIPLVLDGGTTPYREPSTLLSLVDGSGEALPAARILRQGSITAASLAEVVTLAEPVAES